MIYTIKNEWLTAQIDSCGAELKRLLGADGIDYLCPSERRNWDRSAPVLFPNTGAVKDGYATIDGVRYPYAQHGFAKDSEFSAYQQTEDRIEFTLCWNEETLQRFPYRFVLRICYALEKNRLRITTEVENQGKDAMFFSVGFHPGFSCPFSSEESAEEYVLRFPIPMTADRVLLDHALVSGIHAVYWDALNSVPIRQGMFDQGSYTMKYPSCRTIRLESLRSGKYIELELGDFPNLVLWAPKYEPITNICIEPWYGLPDKSDGDHSVEKKNYTIRLALQKKTELSFQITIGE